MNEPESVFSHPTFDDPGGRVEAVDDDALLRHVMGRIGRIRTAKKAQSSAENGQKSAEAQRGVPKSAETRAKMRAAQEARRKREGK